ncbi:MAG: hypothetical protein ABIA04_04095 [Pseudomonadota bacterium]
MSKSEKKLLKKNLVKRLITLGIFITPFAAMNFVGSLNIIDLNKLNNSISNPKIEKSIRLAFQTITDDTRET